MPQWIGFLRAINVGARKYPMQELRAALEAAGYQDVETHIQTGNIRVTSDEATRAKVEADLEEVFERDRGFSVPTIVFTPAELTALADEADKVVAEFGEPEFGHYLELLRAEPNPADVALIEEMPPQQRAVVRGRAVHLLYDVSYHSAKGFPAATKRALGDSTNRNVKVIRKLAELWGA